LVRDLLRDGFRPHRNKIIFTALFLGVTMCAIAIRIPAVMNPLPSVSVAISTCKNIQAGFACYFSDPEVKGAPEQINSWSELAAFLYTCCDFRLNDRAKDARLQFVSYRALKGPAPEARYNYGYVIYFSIYKPPEQYARPFIEVTPYGVQQLTREEYDTFTQIGSVLESYADMSEDRRFPGRIGDWTTLVSICNSSGSNLDEAKVGRGLRFVSYE
jgi:hypothetical protein